MPRILCSNGFICAVYISTLAQYELTLMSEWSRKEAMIYNNVVYQLQIHADCSLPVGGHEIKLSTFCQERAKITPF